MQYTKIHGVELESANDAVVMKFKREGSFEDESVDLWLDSMKKGHVALDVGCYTGLYSILAVKAGFPCIGFEPNETAIKRAESNAVHNDVEIEVMPFALSDESGLATLSLKGKRPLTSAASIASSHADGANVSVNTATIDELDLPVPVSVMKIDAERSEPAVLLGGLEVIKRDKPVIITECLDGQTTLEVSDIMTKLGYRWRALDSCMIAWTPTRRGKKEK